MLEQDPLYALSEPVLDALVEEAPDFFAGDQEWFERDLARTAVHGFFLRRVVGGADSLPFSQPEPLLGHGPGMKRIDQPGYGQRLRKRPGLTLGDFVKEVDRPVEQSFGRLAPFLRPEWLTTGKQDELLKAVRGLLADLWGRGGRGDRVDIQQAQEQWEQEQRLTKARPEAYAGWLLTNREFASELRALRTAWGSEVKRRGGFPLGPLHVSKANAAKTGAPGNAYTRAWLAFYRRWGLDRMLTWELPLPMAPCMNNAGVQDFGPVGDAGVVLFLPWHLLRGGQFDLNRVVQRLKFEDAPEHLAEWVLKKAAGAEDEKGDLTYQRLFWIYRCHYLVLARRYAAARAKHVQQVDRAMGKAMQRGEDLVKKLRLRLAREVQSP
jgi:hypothetical protein